MALRKRIFEAVFPSATQAASPTPTATPLLGTGSFEGSFRIASPASPDIKDTATETIKWERAWHTATAFLSLPVSEPLLDHHGITPSKWMINCPQEVHNSIAYLISEQSLGWTTITGRRQEELLDWYCYEVGRHYTNLVLPGLLQIAAKSLGSDTLSRILRVMKNTQEMYFRPLLRYVIPHIPKRGQHELSKLLDRHHAMVSKSLSGSVLPIHVAQFVRKQAQMILGLDQSPVSVGNEKLPEKGSTSNQAREKFLSMLTELQEVGLGGEPAQRFFAEVMSELMTLYVTVTYAGHWASPSNIPDHLRDWVENHFARLVMEVLACLRGDTDPAPNWKEIFPISVLDNWKERAICDLGALRIKELFEVVIDWDNDSKGAIEDLRQYITTTAARYHLTTNFSAVISDRLLQPGASTTEILQVYICIIRAFTSLDPKGVLIDRLAKPIRRYLRDREDTANIIVSGLLADVGDDLGSADVLVELAEELNNSAETMDADEESGELDWDDMNWMPDPVDAGPEYKKVKSSDIIGTLVSLFETKDVFVKEFQNVIGEQLLKSGTSSEKEVRVLELLKIRFGEGPLQACEVMLRDIVESRRTDTLIRKSSKFTESQVPDEVPQIHTKILSRLFWPALNNDEFRIPPAIENLQTRYAAGFESIKASRKLTWLPALGQVSIELHLQDRIISEDVHTWQASVIYAFQTGSENDEDGDNSSAPPATRTVMQLVESLYMDEPLVLNALTFWVGKLVLRLTAPNTYTVLETLPSSTRDPTDAATDPSDQTALASSAAAAAAAALSTVPTSAVKSEEDVIAEKMHVFWQFIQGMLTNQGAMPLPRMVMMLKFAVPGGFPYGERELKDFLAGMVTEGRLEVVAGNYKIIK